MGTPFERKLGLQECSIGGMGRYYGTAEGLQPVRRGLGTSSTSPLPPKRPSRTRPLDPSSTAATVGWDAQCEELLQAQTQTQAEELHDRWTLVAHKRRDLGVCWAFLLPC